MSLKFTLLLFFLFTFENLYSEEEYFRTLRNDKVNLRQGPSFDHPIKIIYNKKFLPVLVQDRSDNFRKIRDHENNSGWIHVSQLSKKKAALTVDDELVMFSNSTIYSNPVALLKKGRLVQITKCQDEWCKVNSGEFKGWLKKKSLWGLF